MANDWHPTLPAELRTSTSPVSAFFLIESPEDLARMVAKVGLPASSGLTAEQLRAVDTTTRLAWDRRATEPDLKERVWFVSEIPAPEFEGGRPKGCLTVRNFPGRGLEAELILPGILAASTVGLLGDGRDGFFCGFMPPSFYGPLA